MSENQSESPKRQRAVALQYSESEHAPHVVASGAGEIARRIIELAQEHHIPVRKDDSLVNILSKLDIGYEIPPETYRVVAEILAFLYRTDEAWRKKKEAQGVFNSGTS
jgi:flagellar biosynthesis protein